MNSQPEARYEPGILLVLPHPPAPSETFLQTIAKELPGPPTVVYGSGLSAAGAPLLPQNLVARAWRKAVRSARGQGWSAERTQAYLAAITRYRPNVVLAEYGPTGVGALDACQAARVPLVVHFHGYDASRHDLLETMKARYRRMFASTAAVVAVSRVMCDRLVDLGADPDQVHCIPCGIDPEKFRGAQPETAPPSFLSVGRFVEKKSPLLTLRAFATVQGVCRDAKLLMVGEGPLLAQARELAAKLGIAGAVRFLGACPHDAVRTEMRRARCFVQHSVVAPNGDTEGTPVAILEASASGLPVIATRHAGIPDVIVEGTTGFLVEEGDVEGMAGYMVKIAKDAPLAGSLGRAGRRKVIQEFSVERSIGDLWAVLQRASQRRPTDPPSYSRHPR